MCNVLKDCLARFAVCDVQLTIYLKQYAILASCFPSDDSSALPEYFAVFGIHVL